MAVTINKDGSFRITYAGPYTGLHVQAPESLIPDTASPSMSGIQLRNAELRSAPAFVFKLSTPGSSHVHGVFSFIDANSVTHTVAFSHNGLYQLQYDVAGNQSWQLLGGPSGHQAIPTSYRAFANILYYTNGSPFMGSWDGITAAPTSTLTFNAASGFSGGAADNTIAASAAGISKFNAPNIIGGSIGPLAIGGQFLSELDNHLILANVSVLDQLGVNAAGTGAIIPPGTLYAFPNRIWWSANGLPNMWDFAFNTNAGENDFLDVPDNITGIMTIGVAGYIFRTNGITQFVPTGNGIAPFQFDHLWASDHGVGNVYPWSIHSYGPFGCFISVEQIYQVGVNSFSDIGGTARDAIMADLALASDNPVASISPTEAAGYVNLVYRISIPLTTFTRHYEYRFEDRSWAIRDTAGLLVTGREEEIWTGALSSFGTPGLVPPSSGVSGGGGTGGGGTGGGGPQGGGGSRGGKFFN